MYKETTQNNINPYVIPGLKYKLEDIEKLSFDEYVNIVCEFYNVKISDLKSPKKKRDLVEPRMVLMYFALTELKMSQHVTGDLFNRDHATAFNARKRIQIRLSKHPNGQYVDKLFVNKFNELQTIVYKKMKLLIKS